MQKDAQAKIESYHTSMYAYHSQPSVKELLYLIDILGVTPRDFFDEAREVQNPILTEKIMDGIADMSDQDLEAVLHMIERLKAK